MQISHLIKLMINRLNLMKQREHDLRNKIADENISRNEKMQNVQNLKKIEEFILNAISCLTNILFYDTPLRDTSQELITHDVRLLIFQAINNFAHSSDNDEVQVETVRVLSNLSRHEHMCQEFAQVKKGPDGKLAAVKENEEQKSENTFLDDLLHVVKNENKDLVYYGIGIVINITLHKECRLAILSRPFIDQLTHAFSVYELEDMDLAKVAIKALLNLTEESSYWTEDQIKNLDAQLLHIGEELDEIMDVTEKSDDIAQIESYRAKINELVNNLPEIKHACTAEGCKRKFDTKEQLE